MKTFFKRSCTIFVCMIMFIQILAFPASANTPPSENPVSDAEWLQLIEDMEQSPPGTYPLSLTREMHELIWESEDERAIAAYNRILSNAKPVPLPVLTLEEEAALEARALREAREPSGTIDLVTHDLETGQTSYETYTLPTAKIPDSTEPLTE